MHLRIIHITFVLLFPEFISFTRRAREFELNRRRDYSAKNRRRLKIVMYIRSSVENFVELKYKHEVYVVHSECVLFSLYDPNGFNKRRGNNNYQVFNMLIRMVYEHYGTSVSCSFSTF